MTDRLTEIAERAERATAGNATAWTDQMSRAEWDIPFLLAEISAGKAREAELERRLAESEAHRQIGAVKMRDLCRYIQWTQDIAGFAHPTSGSAVIAAKEWANKEASNG